jgi:two-component system cell cycle response regulator DivK
MTTLADGRTVLGFDDIEKNLKVTRDILQSHGLRTLEASDAETGLRLAADSLPDMILMDIELPGTEGVNALERLRECPATARTAVVAVTASVIPVDQERLTRAGFAGIVFKPIEIRAFPSQALSCCNCGKEDTS